MENEDLFFAGDEMYIHKSKWLVNKHNYEIASSDFVVMLNADKNQRVIPKILWNIYFIQILFHGNCSRTAKNIKYFFS